MKYLIIIILSVTSLAPCVSNAQKISNSQKIAAAERAWKIFFPRFRAAVKRRDRAALKKMMVPEFLYSFGGSLDRDEALEYLDNSDARAWEAFAKVLVKGAVSSNRAMHRQLGGGATSPGEQYLSLAKMGAGTAQLSCKEIKGVVDRTRITNACSCATAWFSAKLCSFAVMLIGRRS